MAIGPRYTIVILRAARMQFAALPREEQERLRDDRLIVLMLRIGHRRDVYRKKKT